MDEPTEARLTLVSAGLLSKWGFNDGDAPDEYFDWLEAQGREYAPVSWKPVIFALVDRFVVPALDQQVTIVRIETAHNPVRAQTIDGQDAERYWYGDYRDEEPQLTPETIDIPMTEVDRLVTELAARPDA